MKRPKLTDAERRAVWKAAAHKAAATRRLRLSGLAPIEAIQAGHRQNYTALDTDTLLSLLPGEQAYLDIHISGMQARLAFIRLDMIQRELDARNVTAEEIIAWRFVSCDPESERVAIVERLALTDEPETASLSSLTFDPQEFVA